MLALMKEVLSHTLLIRILFEGSLVSHITDTYTFNELNNIGDVQTDTWTRNQCILLYHRFLLIG